MTRPWPPARARDLLTRHRRALEQLTTALLDQETISGYQVRAIVSAAAGARPLTVGARAASQRP
jgi:hypothetical protein